MIEEEKRQPENYILSKLPKDKLTHLLLYMELIELNPKEILYEANQSIENIYFPEAGCMSIITKLHDGSTVEAITVGKEGMVGLPVFLGATTTKSIALCQVPGKAWVITSTDFVKIIEQDETLQNLLRHYALAVMESMAQSLACNRLHTIEERCARWLLMTHDRIGNNTFSLTQDFLATMLGVHRPGVSLVAKTLQQAGLIDYKHGKMTIVDRRGLEQISCECYEAVRHGFEFQIDGNKLYDT